MLADDGEQERVFSAICAQLTATERIFLYYGSDEDSVGLYGSGTLSGDVLSGTYTFTSGGEDAVVIEVADYDTKAVRAASGKVPTPFPEHRSKMRTAIPMIHLAECS